LQRAHEGPEVVGGGGGEEQPVEGLEERRWHRHERRAELVESLLDHRVSTATAGDLLDQDEGELLPRAERQLAVRGEEVDQVAERDTSRRQSIVENHLFTTTA